MTDTQTAGRFTAMQDWEGAPRRLGAVSMDGAGRLAVVEAPPEHAENLGRIIREMNDSAVLFVRIPPPPGAPRYAVASRQVRRDDPEFVATLRAQLDVYYGITLV